VRTNPIYFGYIAVDAVANKQYAIMDVVLENFMEELQGPRNHVHRGIVDLARAAGAVIVPCVIVPSRRWFLRRTWDRFQIPKPFCRLSMTFAAPLDPHGEPDDARLRESVRAELDALEQRCDPAEAARAQQDDPTSRTAPRGDARARLQ